MRKDGSPAATVAKIFFCFEIKPLVATLLALTLVMLIWNLHPYYVNILPASTFRFSARNALPPLPDASTATAKNGPPSLPLAATAIAGFKIDVPSSPVAHEPPKLNRPPSPKPADPNKRLFTAYGSAAALFVLMGAYRGGPRTFAAVGLASKPIHVFGHPWYKCVWISANGSSVRTKAYKMLPDWGYGRVYTVVVVNCTFGANPNEDNAGGKLILNAYYTESPKRYERITALEEAPGSYDESKYRPPYQYEYLYCGSSLYGDLSPHRIREWMAYHAWFFGSSSHFVFHDAGGVTPAVRAVLEPWMRAGRVTVQDIRAQAEYDGYYFNQFLVVNDCLHRYRYAANWTFYFDVDEYIYLPRGNTLESVMRDFSKYTQFSIEQNAMSSYLCLNDSTQDYSREWGFEKLVFKECRTKVRRDRKYAIQAKNAYSAGVHLSQNLIGPTLHRTESRIRYYHYHNSINVHGELCRRYLPKSAKKKKKATWIDKLPYVYDDNMKTLAQTVKEFERSTIGPVHVPA